MKDERTPQNTFEWAERIGKNSWFLTGISLSDLGDLLAHVRGVKLEAEMFCGLANPPLDPKRQHSHWREADFIERAVLDELKRRNVMQPVEVPQPAKAAISDTLPTLEEVVSDSGTFLPRLWKALGTQPKKPSVLMALAQALLTANKIDRKGFSQEDVYRMLCQHFGIKPADRPRIRGNTGTGYTNAYSDSLSEFNDLLEDL